MSDEQDEREWADCSVCQLTTKPGENLPGGRKNSEVTVVGEPGNATSRTGTVLSRVIRLGSANTGSCEKEVYLGP